MPLVGAMIMYISAVGGGAISRVLGCLRPRKAVGAPARPRIFDYTSVYGRSLRYSHLGPPVTAPLFLQLARCLALQEFTGPG